MVQVNRQTAMQKIEEMKAVLTALDKDVEKFYNKGRDVSGTRIRKAMLALKLLAQEVRNEVTTIKKNAKA